MAVRQRPAKAARAKQSTAKTPSARNTGSKGKKMSRTNGKGTHTHLPQAMSANAAVVAEAIDRSKKSARAMALQASTPTRSERLAGFDATDAMNAWLALPNVWLGAAQNFGRMASPDIAREAMATLADRQLQLWQAMLKSSPIAALMKEQAKAAEAIMKAWQPASGEPQPRSSKKSGKAS